MTEPKVTMTYTRIVCHGCGRDTYRTPSGNYSRHGLNNYGRLCPKSGRPIPGGRA